MSTVKMKFYEDKYVDGKIFARKDREVDVELSSVDRWTKRGGVLVEDPDKVEKMIEEDMADKKRKYQARK